MFSYKTDLEKAPLVVRSGETLERSGRKRFNGKIIAVGLLAAGLLAVALVSGLRTSSNVSSTVLKLEAEDFENAKIRKTEVLSIQQGRLQGSIWKSRKNRDYYAFFSIPYGKAPINSLRFEPPQPAGRWTEGIYDSSRPKTHCVYRDKNKNYPAIIGSEDCLHLHVYTPKFPNARSNMKLPVMVYIYGGAFRTGYSWRYEPKYFMDEDVILVFMEYRSGVFGHLNTGDGIIGGNLSLKDQTLAMKWVRDNIESFGGDPEKVLIFGNSAGSISVHSHMLSDQSRGLFRAAISESGVALGTVINDIFLNNPGSIAKKVGEELKCPDVEDSLELAKCLKEADVVTLANVNRPDIIWGLTGETVPPNGDKSQMFFKDKPINLMRNGDFAKVPWIVGVNSAEEFSTAHDFIANESAIAILNRDWATLMLQNTLQVSPDDDWVDREIRQFYFNGSEKITRADRYALTNLLSDRKWVHPTREAGILHSKHSPVYFYYMSRESNFTLHPNSNYDFPPPYGAGHADELQYTLNQKTFPEVTLSDDRFPFSEALIKTWVSFAYNLVPEPKGMEPWDPIQDSQDGLIWYQLNEKPLRKNIEPFSERMKFWDKIIERKNLYH